MANFVDTQRAKWKAKGWDDYKIAQAVMQQFGPQFWTPEEKAQIKANRGGGLGEFAKGFGSGAIKGGLAGLSTGNPYAAVAGAAVGGIQGGMARNDATGPGARANSAGQGGFNGQPLVHPGLDAAINARATLANQLGNRAFSPFRAQQQSLIDQLRADAEGRGLAQQMVQRQVSGQVQSGIQNQLAQAAGARGGFNPLASRQAAVNSANISGQGGIAASMGGLQAQLAAQGQLQGALGQARGQDQSFMDLTQRGQLDALSQQNQLFNIYGGGAQTAANLANQIELEKMRQKFGSRNDPTGFDKAMAFGTGLIETYAKTRGAGDGNAVDFSGSDYQDGSFQTSMTPAANNRQLGTTPYSSYGGYNQSGNNFYIPKL